VLAELLALLQAFLTILEEDEEPSELLEDDISMNCGNCVAHSSVM
jgi:hypothetical protein